MSAGFSQRWAQTAVDSAQANRTLTLSQVGSKFLFNPEVNEPSFHRSACCLSQHDTMTPLQTMPLLAPFAKSSRKVYLWLVIYARHYYRFLWSAGLAWTQLAPCGTRVEEMLRRKRIFTGSQSPAGFIWRVTQTKFMLMVFTNRKLVSVSIWGRGLHGDRWLTWR